MSEIKRCAYCKKEIGLEELFLVDSRIKNMDYEEAEFVMDQLPKIYFKKRKKSKFSHDCNLEYEVLNVCMVCYEIALEKYKEGCYYERFC